jgi:hypothetical protein
VEIVERDVSKAWGHGFETVFDLILSGGGDASEGSTVEGVEGGDNFEAALLMTKAAGEFEEPFVGLAAAIREEDLARGQMFDDLLCQASLRFVIIEVRHVNEPLRLLDEGLRDLGIGVAEGTDGDAAAEIEETPAAHVVEVAA